MEIRSITAAPEIRSFRIRQTIQTHYRDMPGGDSTTTLADRRPSRSSSDQNGALNRWRTGDDQPDHRQPGLDTINGRLDAVRRRRCRRRLDSQRLPRARRHVARSPVTGRSGGQCSDVKRESETIGEFVTHASPCRERTHAPITHGGVRGQDCEPGAGGGRPNSTGQLYQPL